MEIDVITVATMARWIWENRCKDGFKEFSRASLARDLAKAAARRELAYVVTPDGAIKGVVLCQREDSLKRLHVRDILTTDKRALPMLIGIFRSWYPGWTLTANRRGRFRCYATTRLLSKLTHEH